MDDENTHEQKFRLIIQAPDGAHPWRARLERNEEVHEFDSPLELLEWLEAQYSTPPKGLR